MSNQSPTDDVPFRCQTMVASRTGRPAVEVSWGQVRMVISAAEARRVGLILLETATAAEGDAFLFSFLRNMKMPPEECGAIIVAFRDYREKLEQDGSTQ